MYHELNNLQLEKILQTDKFTSKSFIGVYSSDTLPSVESFQSCFIFNTDQSGGPGEHWIAVYAQSKQICHFFDPLGFPPSFYGVESYLYTFSQNVVSNKRQLQPLFSKKCGYYCFLFLIFKCRGSRPIISEALIKRYFKL